VFINVELFNDFKVLHGVQ